MKKSWKIISLLCVVTALAVCLSACSFFGEDGLSAYEIAVQNGFTGTEQEWLDSFYNETTIKETTNNFYVEGSGTDVSAAANTGLKSVVSVYSYFTTTSTGGGIFFPQHPQEINYSSAGAGVVYTLEEDGSAYVVTNYHVVYDADSDTSDKISDEIYVFLYGMEYSQYGIPATYVGGSMNYDVAVLRIDKSDIVKTAAEKGTLCAVSFGNSDNVAVGQTAIAIGNPEAEGISVSSGIISVTSEDITMTAVDESSTVTMRVIRTDTAINSGNSGGGLFDTQGKLIGIVNAKMKTEKAENIAYAIPANLVKAVADNVVYFCSQSSNKTVMRATLGITLQLQSVSTALDSQGNIVVEEILEVAEVSDGGAAKGALQVGDAIESVTIRGVTTKVTKSYHVSEALLYARPGDTVTLDVTRNGETQKVEITLSESSFSAY